MLSVIYFCIGVLCLCGEDCSATIKQRKFAKVTRSSYGASRLGSPWTEPSLSRCSSSCWSRYGSRCQTILYNSDTGLCTPGSFLKSGTFGAALAPTSTDGDLFAPSVCDTSDGFTYVTSASASACIMETDFTMEADGARNYCNNLGAHLVVIRSLDKFNLLKSDVAYFAGLNDKANEGKMVWEDTGDEIAPDFVPVFFNGGEPNNGGGYEDCVYIWTGKSTNFGNDNPCWNVRMRFVCERPVYV